MQNLVIVESPGKISSIKGYLGANYKVVASIGHIRDLPKSSLGVDTENGFEAHYINIRGKGDLIKQLKKEAKAARCVYLATDPDREGEAISWHLANALDIPISQAKRVTFNEVTKSAVKEGIKHPRQIDMDIVNAQQARRIMDRIVGYKLSPFLWKAVKSGLSAGRVQSVATRIIVDRENEIRAFIPEEYWTLETWLSLEGKEPFKVRFFGTEERKIELHNEADAKRVIDAVSGKPFRVSSIKNGKKAKQPAPPFTTSTLQQEASRKLGFQSARIMRIAQELYEGVNLGSENGGVHGLITYMRTDSLRISADASAAAKAYIEARFGDTYYPDKPRVYNSKSGIQDAHEAIRPSNMDLEPAKIKKSLTNDQFKLYKLIWDRFVASQMASAEIDTLTADFTCEGYLFRASGYHVAFPGYMAVYEESDEEASQKTREEAPEKDMKLPKLSEGQIVTCDSINPQQRFTEPPPRYTEGSLVKFLEEKGIGRPSTFTPIITTIITRSYVKRDGKVFVPTQLGEITTKLMSEYFPKIVDYDFTASMEEQLDDIENGTETMQTLLNGFYGDFEKTLSHAMETVPAVNVEVPLEETDIICDKCGAKMVIKNGRFGRFAACPNYPECKNTKAIDKEGNLIEKKPAEVVKADFKCELCGGDVVIRNGRYGEFYACVNYPRCKFTKQLNKEIGVACPKCGSPLVRRYGRKHNIYFGCIRYPDCDFSSWDQPIPESCPSCGKPLFLKRSKQLVYCAEHDCDYKRNAEPEIIAAADEAIANQTPGKDSEA